MSSIVIVGIMFECFFGACVCVCMCLCVVLEGGRGCLKKLFKSRFRDYNDKTDLNCFQVALKLKILNTWN